MSDTEVKDIDCLTAMMSIFTHAAEKCIMEIEHIYAKEYEAGKEFLALQKKYGSVKAKGGGEPEEKPGKENFETT